MSNSDTVRFTELEARVTALEAQVAMLVEALPKDMMGELYGKEADHTQERATRRGPGRPPGS